MSLKKAIQADGLHQLESKKIINYKRIPPETSIRCAFTQ